MTADVRAVPVRRRSARWLIGFPAVVGAVVVAVAVATGDGLRGCSDVDGSMGCLGNSMLFALVGLPAAVVVTWLVLALGIGAWRAPLVTFAGGWLAVFAWGLSSKVLGIGPNQVTPVWLSAGAGGAGFGTVALACVPGLRRSVRICVIVGLVAAALCTRLAI